ncbi:MAG: LytTR family DNA-binding domain-containing protein [Halieaceae bacterium]|nr:LytTR family DNA-binding domain-containing protein [Halieaceae bacterium]
MKILVVDDETLARERLLRLLEKVAPEALTEEAGNGSQALELVASWQPDLLLLDIRMPGMDGIAVASALQALEQPPAVIFCTAYDQFALQALDNQAVAYLLKPVREEKLREAMGRAGKLNRLQLSALQDGAPARTHLVSESHRGVEMAPVDEVRCLVAEQKYVRAIYPGGSLLLTETLKELEEEFAGRFLRVHRNALVSRSHVMGLDREGADQWCVSLEGVEEKPAVSRRHLSALKESLQRV